MSFHFEYPADYDSQFHSPEPEGMHGVMGSDTVEFAPYREPVVMPETDRARAWKQRLADACKKEVK
jgi:hypothetical protein